MGKYIRPTLQTKYHIDFNWWQQHGQSLHRYLTEHLCDACRDLVDVDTTEKSVDWVDPDTAQVQPVDALWYTIYSHCGRTPDFLGDELTLITAIFRLFLANNNTPLTPIEMHQQLHWKDARTILRTIGGKTVYKGIKPVTPVVAN